MSIGRKRLSLWNSLGTEKCRILTDRRVKSFNPTHGGTLLL